MNIEQLERRLAQLKDLRSAAEAKSSAVLDAAIAENRKTTDDEATILAEARAEIASIDNEATALAPTLDELRKAQADADAAHPTIVEDVEERSAVADEQRQRAVSVGREPLTYEKHEPRTSYVRDLVLVEKHIGKGDVDEARKRLEAHSNEMRVEMPRFEQRQHHGDAEYERRDLDRTDGTGGYFVPPIWMMSDYAALSRGSRVTADLCRRFALPGGTDSINIPKIATGTTTAIQTADNAAISETDLTDTSVQANVKTIAGQQDLSMQAFEQSPIAFDQVILQDLAADHAVKTDVQVISGTDASGQVRGILTIGSVDTTAYTDASPTVPELYPKIADSYNVISTTRYRVPEVVIMHPRRWSWMLAALDSTSRPLVVPAAQGPDNALSGFGGNAAEGFVGTCAFGPIYVDPNIPTNLGTGTDEDVIILTRPSELYLWEGPVRTRILTEVLSANLTVRVQLYNYLAFMPDRWAESTSIVSGTGLVAPTF